MKEKLIEKVQIANAALQIYAEDGLEQTATEE